jgi:hypothetical protein
MNAIRPTPGPNGLTPDEEKPRPAGHLCDKCGKIIYEWDGVAQCHSWCQEGWSAAGVDPKRPVGFDHPMRRHLIDLIKRHDASSARSRQAAIGPSELGTTCDRRLAMRMAGVETINRFADPWPAIAGTAVHTWLEDMLQADNRRLGRNRWLTEITVEVDPLVKGHSDAYDTDECRVIDWKNPKADKVSTLRQRMERGDLEGYKIQGMCYGLGMYRAGYRVDTVALMFLPMGGLLRNAAYVEWPFEPAVAQRALERLYAVGREVIELQRQRPGVDIWGLVPCDVSQLCGWCPFYNKSAVEASQRGCPGR